MDRYEGLGIVRHGELAFDRDRMARALADMPDGVVTVSVERRRANRSTQANRFYWKTLVERIAMHTEQDRESIHEALKLRCNPILIEVADPSTGEIRELWVGGSTRKLDTAAFSAYIERCRVFAAEFFGMEFEEFSEAA
jgi:hypothetical protein